MIDSDINPRLRERASLAFSFPDNEGFATFLSHGRNRLFTLSTMAAMLEFRTRGFNPYAVKYSPYYDNRVAVAAAANFGIVGCGRVFALGLTAAGIQVEKTYGIPCFIDHCHSD